MTQRSKPAMRFVYSPLILGAFFLASCTPPEGVDLDKPNNDAFEGLYLVGQTECTVQPVRMAYELRCANEATTEYFFYDEKSSSEKTAVFRTDRAYSPTTEAVFTFSGRQFHEGTYKAATGVRVKVIRR